MGLPQPGSMDWEKMVEFMRKDLASGMQYTKIEMAARKLLEEQGQDFDTEFQKWKEKKTTYA